MQKGGSGCRKRKPKVLKVDATVREWADEDLLRDCEVAGIAVHSLKFLSADSVYNATRDHEQTSNERKRLKRQIASLQERLVEVEKECSVLLAALDVTIEVVNRRLRGVPLPKFPGKSKEKSEKKGEAK